MYLTPSFNPHTQQSIQFFSLFLLSHHFHQRKKRLIFFFYLRWSTWHSCRHYRKTAFAPGHHSPDHGFHNHNHNYSCYPRKKIPNLFFFSFFAITHTHTHEKKKTKYKQYTLVKKKSYCFLFKRSIFFTHKFFLHWNNTEES